MIRSLLVLDARIERNAAAGKFDGKKSDKAKKELADKGMTP